MTAIRTSKADANLFSISQNIVQLYAGTDRAFTQSQLPPGTVIDGKVLDDTSQPWDATLKVCDSTTGVTFTNLRANQGMENVVDCNAGANHCFFSGEYGMEGQVGDQVITVKGGCSALYFSGVVHSTGRNATIVIGAWSDQSTSPSTNLDFSALTSPHPITVILARCRDVRLPPGAKVLLWKSLGYRAYWYAKWVYVQALKLIHR